MRWTGGVIIDGDLAAFTITTHGVFTATHARSVGFSPQQIKSRVSDGRWVHLHDDVYRFVGVRPDWKGDLLAACWAGGFRAHASHRSAAALWGLAGGRKSFAEITCPRWRRARHDGVIVHETKRIELLDLSERDGIPITSVARTLLDLGAVCSASVVELAVDQAERRDLVTIPDLRATLRRLGRPGRNGAGVLRAVLDDRKDGRRCDSEPETMLLQVLRRHGLPEPETQYEIRDPAGGTMRVDAAYPQWRVAIEYDSDEHHAGRLAHRRDSNRRLRIAGAGYEPLTATYDELRAGGPNLVRAIRSAKTRFGVA